MTSMTFGTWEEANEYINSLTNGQAEGDSQKKTAVGNQFGGGQGLGDYHGTIAPASNFTNGHRQYDNQSEIAVGEPNPDRIVHYGSVLDLWEGFRKGINNQLRAFIKYHGVGLPEGAYTEDEIKDEMKRATVFRSMSFYESIFDPSIRQAMDYHDSIRGYEDGVAKVLEKSMMLHPLADFVHSTPGLGPKTVGRVLAAVGNPAWNQTADCPRSRDQLRQYCGWGDPVAQRRRKGMKGNWNPRARTAVWNVAVPMIRNRNSFYRPAYDEARERYADTVHDNPCAQCGTPGQPAKVGTPLRPGHQQARGIRAVCKEFLDDLHAEAKGLS